MKKTCDVLILVVVTLLSAAPVAADDGSRYLIYLHGAIVQIQQDPRPRHPQRGVYELEKILEAFRDRGFIVTGEIRPRSTTVSESADHVADQVGKLLESGVPAGHITVVGGSMGGAIALVASARLQEADVRFAVLGNCLTERAGEISTSEGKALSGHVLSIREESDELTRGCKPWQTTPETAPSLFAREIVIHTGKGHGFLFRPIPQWLDPVLAWTGIESGSKKGD